MSLKVLICFGLLSVFFCQTLGFTLPDDNEKNVPDVIDDRWITGELVRRDNIYYPVRKVRSPQNSVSAAFGHSHPGGSSASFDYTRQLSKNLEAYAGASRNFKYNDNSAHAGLRYRF